MAGAKSGGDDLGGTMTTARRVTVFMARAFGRGLGSSHFIIAACGPAPPGS